MYMNVIVGISRLQTTNFAFVHGSYASDNIQLVQMQYSSAWRTVVQRAILLLYIRQMCSKSYHDDDGPYRDPWHRIVQPLALNTLADLG